MTSESRSRYQALRALHDSRANELRNGLRVLRDPEQGPIEVKDPEEQGLCQTERELDVAVLQLKAETCRSIEDALSQIRSGRFGRCESCGAPIPPARLRAVPFAVRCRACQEMAEAAETTGSGEAPLWAS
jgi:RNA polymerase-binding transcription factor